MISWSVFSGIVVGFLGITRSSILASFQLLIIAQEFIATLFNDSLHSYPRVLHILCNAKYIDDTII